mmetsp:Transcript_11436/g.21654  ORF Transcript_11436/g.21654 Transcript_11436/m.21654 type:complete len:326 (-) Transcript_11436:35-1012(-)
MGKKKKDSSDSSEESKKKKKKKDSKKKKKEVKKKKDKKKKDKKKKDKKKDSSSSSSGSEEDGSGGEKAEEATSPKKSAELMKPPLELSPPEEGILRFVFTVEEVGPLGLRFSGGFPPMILAVNPDTFASKKKIPATYEVHAVNGLALVPQNLEVVMPMLKSRPVTLDVRPPGWKPPDKMKEIQRKREREEAELAIQVEMENDRRKKVAVEMKEQQEREAAERAEREERERAEHEEALQAAREARAIQRAKDEEFMRQINSDPEELRNAASNLMEAEYGSEVQLEGRPASVPLRLFTRRREVAWIWAGEVMELIGGGINDDGDKWE